MSEKRKKIKSKDGKLMYEGYTLNGKPCGTGTSYFENGNKYQEGVFNERGLLYGREYYSNGVIRFEGSYKPGVKDGPNYPTFGYCYDEDANEMYYGEVFIYEGHREIPVVRRPECYGLVVPTGAPDFMTMTWKSGGRKPEGKYYARPRGKKARTNFIEFLEKNGFTCEVDELTSRESTIESKFPVVVDLDRKVYGHLHTTTSAAAAATSRMVMPVDRFCSFFECVYSYVIV